MTRVLSRILIGAGVLLLAWVILVWQWQDPFTALYTHWQQDRLAHALDTEFAAFTPLRTAAGIAERDAISAEAARFRSSTHAGEAIGRIVIGRIGLRMVLVDGTDTSCTRSS